MHRSDRGRRRQDHHQHLTLRWMLETQGTSTIPKKSYWIKILVAQRLLIFKLCFIEQVFFNVLIPTSSNL